MLLSQAKAFFNLNGAPPGGSVETRTGGVVLDNRAGATAITASIAWRIRANLASDGSVSALSGGYLELEMIPPDRISPDASLAGLVSEARNPTQRLADGGGSFPLGEAGALTDISEGVEDVTIAAGWVAVLRHEFTLGMTIGTEGGLANVDGGSELTLQSLTLAGGSPPQPDPDDPEQVGGPGAPDALIPAPPTFGALALAVVALAAAARRGRAACRRRGNGADGPCRDDERIIAAG